MGEDEDQHAQVEWKRIRIRMQVWIRILMRMTIRLTMTSIVINHLFVVIFWLFFVTYSLTEMNCKFTPNVFS